MNHMPPRLPQTPARAGGFLAAAAALGLLFGLWGHPGAALGRVGAPATGSAGIGAPGRLDDGLMPGDPCALTADPLTRVAPGEGLALVGSVAPSGRMSVTLRALQASWKGPYRLRAIHLGELTVDVDSPSPALVALAGGTGVTIRGGDAARALRLEFSLEPGAADPTFQLGPTFLLGGKGCALTLTEAAGAAPTRCGLEIGAPRVDGAKPNLVEVALTNRGSSSLDVRAIELVWPVEANGAIETWWLSYHKPLLATFGGAVRPPVLAPPGMRPDQADPTPRPGDNLGRSPVLLPISAEGKRVLPPGGLPPGGSLVLSLRFARPAAAGGYRLSATTEEGCRATFSDLAADTGCAMAWQRLKLGPGSLSAQLGNSGHLTNTLRSLSLQWDERTAGALSEVWLGGRQQAIGKEPGAPVILALDPPVAIGPGSFIDLALVFRAPGSGGSAAPLGTDDAPGGGSGLGDVGILATFADGCTSALTTVRPDEELGCRLSGGELQRDPEGKANEVQAALSNMGGAARLGRIALRWPAHNGALVQITLDGMELLAKPQAYDAAQAVVVDIPKGLGEIKADSRALLRLAFANPAARLGYTVLLSFEDGAGQPCSELRLGGPAGPVECKLGLDLQAVGLDKAELVVHSAGADPLTLSDLQIDWPTDDGWQLTRLRSVAVIQDGKGEVRLPLGDNNLPPPVAVRLADLGLPPILVGSGPPDTRLSLQFDQVRDAAALPEVLRAAVGFAEGCRAVFPRDGGLPAPPRKTLDATIVALPDAAALFAGHWALRDSQGQQWDVQVGADAEIVPSNFTPRVGDRVQALLEFADDGTPWARRISLMAGRPERKLVGQITALDPPSTPGGLPGGLVVDEQKVFLQDGFTRVDAPEALRVGATVVVEAILDLDHRLIAWTVIVQATASTQPEPITFRGVVQGASLGISGPFPLSIIAWTVTPYTVWLPLGLEMLLESADVGRTVEVRGVRLGDHVLADAITILPSLAPPYRLVGSITALPAGGLQGEWLIDRGDPGAPNLVRVQVPDLAVIDSRQAAAAIGQRVQAVVRDGDGGRMALRLRILSP